MAQTVNNLPIVQETQVQSLGGEDTLEKGMATTLVLLPREFHRERRLVGYSPQDCQELGPIERLTLEQNSFEKCCEKTINSFQKRNLVAI